MRYTIKMKKITIRNKEYAVKKLTRVVVDPQGGALVKRKEVVVYRNAFAVVWYEDGEREVYTNGRNQESQLSLFYYDPDDAMTEIFFPEGMLREWKKLFIYLADEHGAFLLYACKRLMRYVTPRCRLVSELYMEEVKAEALNILGMLDDGLLEQMLNVERLRDDDDEKGFLLGVLPYDR